MLIRYAEMVALWFEIDNKQMLPCFNLWIIVTAQQQPQPQQQNNQNFSWVETK